MYCGRPLMEDRDCEGHYDKGHSFCIDVCCFRERYIRKTELKKKKELK